MATFSVNLLINRLNNGFDMPVDRLTPLLTRFKPRANVFFAGKLCDSYTSDERRPVGHIHWIFEGKVDLIVRGGQVQALTQPCVVFLPNPVDHTLKPQLEAEILCCEFDFGHREANPLIMVPNTAIIIDMGQASEFGPLGQLIKEEFARKRCGQRFGLTQLMQYFILLLLRHLISVQGLPSGITRALSDPKLLRAVTAMHTQPQQHWTLERLAQEAGMSRAAFASHFKNATGYTALDYLTDWRLSLVKSMLLAGKSVKQSAFEVGYSSSAALIRVFQRRVKASPTEWRDKQQAA